MQKIEKIKNHGFENLQLVLDFDRTITGPVNGNPAPPMISFLRESDILGEKYREEAQANFQYYYPFEKSHDLTHEQKSSLMHEWWSKHLNQLVQFGLSGEKIFKIAHSPNLLLRDGVKELFEFAQANNIPIVIFSAGILGSESIKLFLERFQILLPNVKIITNELIFDSSEMVIGFKEPIIHSENKDESMLEIEGVISRKNTILAGDGVGDTKMVADGEGKTVYRIGILDTDNEEEKQKYLNFFDEVTNSFNAIISILDK